MDYRDPGPVLDIPPSQIPRKTPLGKILGAMAIGGLAVAGVMVFINARQERAKAAARAEAWSRLEVCLAGPADGAKLSARYRQAQLAVAEVDPKELKEETSQRWPTRCADHARGFYHVLVDQRLSKPGQADLGTMANTFAGRLLSDSYETRLADLSKEIDELSAGAAALKITSVSVSGIKAPTLAPKPLLTLGALKKVRPLGGSKAFPLSAIRLEAQRHRDLVFVATDPTIPTPFQCVIADGARKVVCKKVVQAAADAGDLRLDEARDPGAPILFNAGRIAANGVFRADTGAKVLTDKRFGWAWARGDGTVVTLGYEEDRQLLLSLPGEEKPTEVKLPGHVTNENLAFAVGLVPGYVLFRGANTADEVRLFAAKIAGNAVEPAAEVGELAGWHTYGNTAQLTSCRGDASTFHVLVEDTAGLHVVTNSGGKWGSMATTFNGDHSCNASSVTITSTGTGTLLQSKCSSAGCIPNTAVVPTARRRVGVDLEGAVATLGQMDERGGLHLRVGSMASLPGQKSVLALDDWTTEEGPTPKSWLFEFAAYPVGKAGVFVLSTVAGNFVVRVDETGALTPIDVEGP